MYAGLHNRVFHKSSDVEEHLLREQLFNLFPAMSNFVVFFFFLAESISYSIQRLIISSRGVSTFIDVKSVNFLLMLQKKIPTYVNVTKAHIYKYNYPVE